MRNKIWAIIPAVALIAVSACSDTSTAPVAPDDATAAFVKQGTPGDKGGGVGSPHFAEPIGLPHVDPNHCTLDSETGELTCDYQIAGLGKRGSALVTLAAILDVDLECENYSGTRTRYRKTIRIDADQTVFANESGNATGTLQDTPDLAVTNVDCIVMAGPLYYKLVGHSFNLNETSKIGVPILPGEWMLNAVARTAKGPARVFYYGGPLFPANPI